MFQIVRAVALPNVRLSPDAIEPHSQESSKLVAPVSALLVDVELVTDNHTKNSTAKDSGDNREHVWSWGWHFVGWIIGFMVVIAVWPNSKLGGGADNPPARKL
jgi:hypothetical protein